MHHMHQAPPRITSYNVCYTKLLRTDYGLMVAIILSTIPMMAMIMPGWFDALMNTLAGKIALAIVLLAIFLCTIGVV